MYIYIYTLVFEGSAKLVKELKTVMNFDSYSYNYDFFVVKFSQIYLGACHVKHTWPLTWERTYP